VLSEKLFHSDVLNNKKENTIFFLMANYQLIINIQCRTFVFGY